MCRRRFIFSGTAGQNIISPGGKNSQLLLFNTNSLFAISKRTVSQRYSFLSDTQVLLINVSIQNESPFHIDDASCSKVLSRHDGRSGKVLTRYQLMKCQQSAHPPKAKNRLPLARLFLFCQLCLRISLRDALP